MKNAKIRSQRLLTKKYKGKSREQRNGTNNDPEYGENCRKSDLLPEIFKVMEEEFKKKCSWATMK